MRGCCASNSATRRVKASCSATREMNVTVRGALSSPGAGPRSPPVVPGSPAQAPPSTAAPPPAAPRSTARRVALTSPRRPAPAGGAAPGPVLVVIVPFALPPPRRPPRLHRPPAPGQAGAAGVVRRLRRRPVAHPQVRRLQAAPALEARGHHGVDHAGRQQRALDRVGRLARLDQALD